MSMFPPFNLILCLRAIKQGVLLSFVEQSCCEPMSYEACELTRQTSENKSFGAHSAQIAGGEADDKGCTTCDQPRSAGRHRPHREGVLSHIPGSDNEDDGGRGRG